MLCEPDVKTTQVSQLLHGHVAQVVERNGLWLHVTSADGYNGWVHQGYVVTWSHSPLRSTTCATCP